MATASPSIGVIRAQIRAIRNKAPNAKAFGIFAPGRWAGTAVQGEGSDQIAVYCVFDLVGTSRLRKTLAADRDVA